MKNKHLSIKESKIGKGVFTNKKFAIREKIKDFQDKFLTYEQLPKPYDQVKDFYLQVGHNLYQGPAEGIDCYFNHSCNPNTGLHIKNSKVSLVAIQNIDKNEEITFDYSTSMDEDEWEMDCICGRQNCRGRIRDFKYLPKDVQEKYIKLAVVPEFILKNYLNLLHPKNSKIIEN